MFVVLDWQPSCDELQVLPFVKTSRRRILLGFATQRGREVTGVSVRLLSFLILKFDVMLFGSLSMPFGLWH